MNGLVELLAFADMAIHTNLSSDEVRRIARRRLPCYGVVLIRTRLALCDGKTYRG
jgi:hypothetical protein